MRRLRLSLLASLALLGLGALSCDSVDPVAPSDALLTISATPNRIASGGSSDIVVTARRSDGFPVNPGTPITMATNVGVIDTQVSTDGQGMARATLRGNGEVGLATVRANAGAAAEVMVEVQVGILASSITLQATPASMAETGGRVDLLALVRDDQAQPLPNAAVNFSSDVGRLDSGGDFLITDAEGRVTDTLRANAGELDAVNSDSFQVSAEVGGDGGGLITVNRTIAILRLPMADFSFGTSGLTVVFTDTSTGRPSSWRWDFGDGNTSTLQNPTHTYAQPGTYTVTLMAINNQGQDTISKFVAVTGNN